MAHLFLVVNLKVTVTAWVSFLQLIITAKKREKVLKLCLYPATWIKMIFDVIQIYMKCSRMSVENDKKHNQKDLIYIHEALVSPGWHAYQVSFNKRVL